MLTTRQLSALALIGALMQGAAAGPSFAAPGSELAAVSHPTDVRPVARKGTRNYIPETIPEDTKDATVTDKDSEKKALADCIAIWDDKTHITKTKWREICKRQLKERGAQLSVH